MYNAICYTRSALCLFFNVFTHFFIHFYYFYTYSPFTILYPTALYSALFGNKEENETHQVMEELPRNLLVNIPLKVPDKLEWTPSLQQYIETSYAEDTAKYDEDCRLLDTLREYSLNQSSNASFALENLSM